MSESNKIENRMSSNSKNNQDLNQQIVILRDEKERLLRVISEREELMANMFSYLQNFSVKAKS